MKLLITQILLYIVLFVTCIFWQPYSWIPFVLMFIPTILLIGLALNWPIIGWLAAKIEGGRNLFVMVFEEPHKVDTLLTRGNNQWIRILHTRRSTKTSRYKHWVVIFKNSQTSPIK